MERCVASSSTRPCVDKGRVLLDFIRDKPELHGAVWDAELCSPAPARCAARGGEHRWGKTLGFYPGRINTHAQRVPCFSSSR